MFSRLKDSDPAVLSEIWQRFFPRMAGLARKSLAKRPDGSADVEDVVQSAFVSFWRAVESTPQPEFRDRDDLWRFLGVMVFRKARRQSRRAGARKRGGGRVVSESQLVPAGNREDEGGVRLDRLLADISPPDFDLFCEEMLLALDESSRRLALLRLQGHSTAEIASRLECSERSVQRCLKSVRERWEQLGADD
jgi:RNA polymerase sigma factor (sigma-70 family)